MTGTSDPDAALALKVPRSRAEELIDQQANRGQELVDAANRVGSHGEFEEWREIQTRWRRFTVDALRSIYTNGDPADEFERAASPGVIVAVEQNVAEQLRYDVEDVRDGINALVSLRERLEFVPTLTDEAADLGAEPEPDAERASQVFVVHGHDDATKEKVVRQVEKAGSYAVIVLHEQANEGRTLIEKFEEYASKSDFAVILLTADDVGAPRDNQDELRPRGRQNVIFELGYFVGALGRSQVAVLYEDGVVFPSDYKGIVYIRLGDEAWRYKLLKELKAAGLDYDLNQIV